MKKKYKKPSSKSSKKQDSKHLNKGFSFIFYILLAIIIFGVSGFVISKSIRHASFYKNYVVFIEKTKVVLYPDITQKDAKANSKAWIEFMKHYVNQYKTDLSSLNDHVLQIEKKAKEGKQEEIKFLVLETRNNLLKIVKNKNYYSQTIMMEDLLTLILDIEKSIDKKDPSILMEQCQNFNSKFTFVIPGLIKSDVVLVGDLMDRLYKQALYQNMDEAKIIYQKIKPAFIDAYRDYRAK